MPDILGFGNAIVDLTVKRSAVNLPLPELDANRGGFFRATAEEFALLTQDISQYRVNAGGSVCNSLKALSVLGAETAFIGTIGHDDLGAEFAKSLQEYHVTNYLKFAEGQKSACTIIFVDDDGEKTICGKMRAAKNLVLTDGDFELIAASKMIFAEGYLLDHVPAEVQKIVNFAAQNGVKVALTLSDPKIVAENRDILSGLLSKTDILLGNQDEFAALESCSVPLQVKTLGAKGVAIINNGEEMFFPAQKVMDIVNTNGAGDAFAGGFLFAVLNNRSLDKAVFQGQTCAVNVLRQEGCAVNKNLEKIL